MSIPEDTERTSCYAELNRGIRQTEGLEEFCSQLSLPVYLGMEATAAVGHPNLEAAGDNLEVAGANLEATGELDLWKFVDGGLQIPIQPLSRPSGQWSGTFNDKL